MADKFTTGSGLNIGVGVVIKKNLVTSAKQTFDKFVAECEDKGKISLKVKTDTSGAKQEIATFVNEFGDYMKTLTKFGADGKLVSKEITEVGVNAQKASEMIARAEEKERKEKEKTNQAFKRQLEEKERLRQQEIEKAERDAKKQAEAEQKALAKATAQAQKEAEKQAKALEKQALAEKKATEQAQRLAEKQRQLAEETRRNNSIIRNFTDTFLKMVKFNTINLIYDGLIDSMRNAIEVTKEFNTATTELRKVSDLEGESLREYARELAEYGAKVGRTMTDMVNSATVFKRTGATDEEAMQLATVAEMFRNVADSEITSAEASSFLVSQMKAFNITADDSIHIIDAVNSVANNYAVSTDDLQVALSKSAAAMATAGNTYEETIALVESATAIMQGNAGTVGNGLRTIAINIANLATKQDAFVNSNGKVRVALKDTEGNVRSTYAVLNDLAQYWDDLSVAEQNEIAVSLAGKHKLIPRLARSKPI